ncbi:hypothetical protein TWF679_001532 [Orbilia oligospora]|uniref:Uncharacterized protein n=1 Tax=Orbilia oligospora TaxID=2813651 RepID=A0A8H8UVF1_ORBOL|nr:hypothetical protein TWF679_001532 [Orbilia oligospora]
MHIKYAAALAIVALVPEVSDHPVWDNAIGDADPTIRGYVIADIPVLKTLSSHPPQKVNGGRNPASTGPTDAELPL